MRSWSWYSALVYFECFLMTTAIIRTTFTKECYHETLENFSEFNIHDYKKYVLNNLKDHPIALKVSATNSEIKSISLILSASILNKNPRRLRLTNLMKRTR